MDRFIQKLLELPKGRPTNLSTVEVLGKVLDILMDTPDEDRFELILKLRRVVAQELGVDLSNLDRIRF